MSNRKSEPPGLAIWLLLHLFPGHNDALIGDLIERFHEGQTRGWFWRQILIAFALSALSKIRRHWPYLCYAIAGTATPGFLFLWQAGDQMRRLIPWWRLPWPLSMFVLELSPFILCAVAALPVLGAALIITRRFRWVNVFRTGAINLVLVTLYHYLPDMFPSLLRAMANNPNRKVLIIPPAFQLLLLVSTFWVAAWLGCSSPRNTDKSKEQVEA